MKQDTVKVPIVMPKLLVTEITPTRVELSVRYSDVAIANLLPETSLILRAVMETFVDYAHLIYPRYKFTIQLAYDIMTFNHNIRIVIDNVSNVEVVKNFLNADFANRLFDKLYAMSDN